MPVIDVGDGFAETLSVGLFQKANGKTKFALDDGSRSRLAIGDTDAVGDLTEVDRKGRPATELRELVGKKIGPGDVGELLDRLTTGAGNGRGEIEGVDGLELLSLTRDAFTVRFGDGPGADVITFEVGAAFVAERAGGADLGDGKSRLAVVEDGQDFVGGTRASGLRDLLNDGTRNEIAGVEGRARLLEAALDEEDGRVELLGVEEDNFAVRLRNGDLTDTFVFAGRDAREAVARVAARPPDELIGLDDLVPELVLASEDVPFLATFAAGVEGFGDVFEGVLSGDDRTAELGELVDFIRSDPGDPRIEVVDQGGTVRITLESGDVVVVDDAFLIGS